MTRLVNKFPGRCACGTYVQESKGYVNNRKITCIQCVPLRAPPPSAFSIEYQGCATTDEHLSEWFLDHYENESHFVGWDVGGQ